METEGEKMNSKTPVCPKCGMHSIEYPDTCETRISISGLLTSMTARCKKCDLSFPLSAQFSWESWHEET